jgi:hypothetical protein
MKKMEGFLQNKGFCDTDEKHNIRLSILGGQLYDMADCSIRVKLSYMFEYPTCQDIPIEYSSCNEAKIITKEYVDDFMTKNDTNIILEDWNKSFEISKKYGLDNTYLFYRNKTKEYLLKNSNEIDFEQNSQGEIFKYLLTFDSFNELTKLKDIYFEDKDKKIFYNEEIIINIKGKLRLSYDKDESEEFLREINADYPSKTYGIIESKFISISFQGKLFLCNFLYIKRHDEKNKKELIYFFGYIGNKAVFTQSYLDNKKRNEKWLKVHFSNIIPINNLVISGPYDIDNLSLTFLNKNYDDSDLYRIYKKQNVAKLIKDEDI